MGVDDGTTNESTICVGFFLDGGGGGGGVAEGGGEGRGEHAA